MLGCCYFQYSAWCASFLYFHCYLFFYSLLPLSTLHMCIVFPVFSIRTYLKLKNFFFNIFFFTQQNEDMNVEVSPACPIRTCQGFLVSDCLCFLDPISLPLSLSLSTHTFIMMHLLDLSPHLHLHHLPVNVTTKIHQKIHKGRYHGPIRLVEAFRGYSGLWKSKLLHHKALEILEKHKREMMLGGQKSRGQILDGKEEQGWGIMSKYESGWKWRQQRVFFCWVWGMSAPSQTIAIPVPTHWPFWGI